MRLGHPIHYQNCAQQHEKLQNPAQRRKATLLLSHVGRQQALLEFPLGFSELNMPSISVIYPVLNESVLLESTIRRSLESLEKHFDDFEIIIMEDGSTDSTPEVAARLASEHPQITVFRNPTNIGQGASILRGMALSTKDWVMHNGIDYPFNLDDLAGMIPLLPENDMIVVSSEARSGYSLRRTFVTHINRALIRFLFQIPMKDFNYVQLYRGEFARKISVNVDARSTGFVTPELLVRFKDYGLRIAETQSPHLPRTAGKASPKVKIIVHSTMDMLRFFVKRLVSGSYREEARLFKSRKASTVRKASQRETAGV